MNGKRVIKKPLLVYKSFCSTMGYTRSKFKKLKRNKCSIKTAPEFKKRGISWSYSKTYSMSYSKTYSMSYSISFRWYKINNWYHDFYFHNFVPFVALCICEIRDNIILVIVGKRYGQSFKFSGLCFLYSSLSYIFCRNKTSIMDIIKDKV